MSDDQPNRDHRCRTCEHWNAPFVESGKNEAPHPCACEVPFFAVPPTGLQRMRTQGEGEFCAAYSYSYRRARLVKP